MDEKKTDIAHVLILRQAQSLLWFPDVILCSFCPFIGLWIYLIIKILGLSHDRQEAFKQWLLELMAKMIHIWNKISISMTVKQTLQLYLLFSHYLGQALQCTRGFYGKFQPASMGGVVQMLSQVTNYPNHHHPDWTIVSSEINTHILTAHTVVFFPTCGNKAR